MQDRKYNRIYLYPVIPLSGVSRYIPISLELLEILIIATSWHPRHESKFTYERALHKLYFLYFANTIICNIVRWVCDIVRYNSTRHTSSFHEWIIEAAIIILSYSNNIPGHCVTCGFNPFTYLLKKITKLK